MTDSQIYMLEQAIRNIEDVLRTKNKKANVLIIKINSAGNYCRMVEEELKNNER